MEFAVTFAIVKCGRGAERQAGVRCPTCGRGADEIDPLVAGRRRVRELAWSGSTAEANREVLDPEKAFGILGAWTTTFMETMENVAKQLEVESDEATQEALGGELLGPVAELDDLMERAASATRLRPTLRVWRIVDRVLATLHDMRQSYLDAFIAVSPTPTPRKRQTRARLRWTGPYRARESEPLAGRTEQRDCNPRGEP